MQLPILWRFDPHVRDVAWKSGMAFGLRIIGAGFGFLFNVKLAHLFGAQGAGVYYLAFTVATVATVFGRMGLDNALLRFTATHASQDDWGAVKGIYRHGVSLAVTASGLCAVVVISLAPLVSREVFSEPALTNPMRVMGLSIVPMSLIILHGELLKGLGRVRDAAMLQGVAMSVLSFLLLLLARPGWGVLGAVLAYTFASAAILLVAIFLWRRATPQLRAIGGGFDRQLLVATSFPLLLVASMDLVMSFTDTVVPGIFGQAADVGVYGAVMRTAMLVSFVLIAVNSVVAPKFAALFDRGDMTALGSVARNSTRIMIFMAAPALLMFLPVPEMVLRIFGTGFQTGATALAILAVGQFVNVATGPVGYLLTMSGHQKVLRNINVGGASLNVCLNLLLVPTFGMNGAAFATTTSWVMLSLAAVYFVRRRLHINIWRAKG